MEIYTGTGQLLYRSAVIAEKNHKPARLCNRSNVQKPKKANTGLVPPVNENDLLNYINTIRAQNEKLREISWIQSHLVRGPLARIMGLVHVVSNLKDHDEMGTIMEYLLLSAHELDTAIREISDKS